MNWHDRIRRAFTGPTPDEDVVDELAQHASATYEAARADGCDVDEAQTVVDDQIREWAQNADALRRRPRRAPVVPPPGSVSLGPFALAHDIRYAWRMLTRQPGYSAVVILTMALGIAATTVLSSVAYSVLIKPLPWAGAPRLVRLYETRQGSTRRFR